MKDVHVDRVPAPIGPTEELSAPGLPPLLTVRQVADYFQVNVRTIWRWVEDGMLPALKLATQVRFRREDVVGFPSPRDGGS